MSSLTILDAVILGIVQGLTEFLPISSTAHLRIVPALLGRGDPGGAFSAVIQLGTLAAVVAVMWRDLRRLAGGCLTALASGRPLATPESRTALAIVVGTVPIVVCGLLFKDLIKGPLRSLESIIAALVGATVVMAAAEIVARRRDGHGQHGRHGLDAVTFRDTLAMGCAQALALLPGTSRSGITIATGMFAGLDRETAARFSFLLSLPAITAAAVLEAVEERTAILGSPDARAAMIWGTATAALVGFLSIRWLLRLLATRTLWPFVAYRLLLAALLAALLAPGWLPEPAAGLPGGGSERGSIPNRLSFL
jgi:undecaprenyl-diphosphatase